MTLTCKLRNGATVLAKLYKGEPCAKTYGNRTQANKAAEAVGGTVYRFLGRPFYVVIDLPKCPDCCGNPKCCPGHIGKTHSGGDRQNYCRECGYAAHCWTEKGHGEVHRCQCHDCVKAHEEGRE